MSTELYKQFFDDCGITHPKRKSYEKYLEMYLKYEKTFDKDVQFITNRQEFCLKNECLIRKYGFGSNPPLFVSQIKSSLRACVLSDPELVCCLVDILEGQGVRRLADNFVLGIMCVCQRDWTVAFVKLVDSLYANGYSPLSYLSNITNMSNVHKLPFINAIISQSPEYCTNELILNVVECSRLWIDRVRDAVVEKLLFHYHKLKIFNRRDISIFATNTPL